MSGAAEHVRADALKRQAAQAVQRAEKLWAHIDGLYENGAEPSASLEAEYTAACRRAEVLILEAAAARGEALDD